MLQDFVAERAGDDVAFHTFERAGSGRDSIADAPEVLELTAAQRAELDRRLEAHRESRVKQSPGRRSSWRRTGVTIDRPGRRRIA